MKIWLDITNTPQVHFLLAIKKGLNERGYTDFILSARDFSETAKFLKQKTDLPIKIIGGHEGKNMSRKAFGLVKRFFEINKGIANYDVSLSCGSEGAIWSSFLKGKNTIAYGDNDLARQWTYGIFVKHAMFPKTISKKILNRQGISNKKLYQYDGFKEHVYIADYEPDKSFLSNLPFDDYIVVRPENIQANYVQGELSKSITPKLLMLLSEKGSNILYLPRYATDREYAKGIKNLFIPDKPLNGLDACYYSLGVFTGAGTFAREAACLGVPSFSFFLGASLLAVDKELIKQNKMYFSRDPYSLVENYLKSDRITADLQKAKEVKLEVIEKTIDFLK